MKNETEPNTKPAHASADFELCQFQKWKDLYFGGVDEGLCQRAWAAARSHEEIEQYNLEKIEPCPSCGALYDGYAAVVCSTCEKLFPPSLLKALCDYFDAAVGLRDGTVIRFSNGSVHGDFIHLENEVGLPQIQGRCPYPFARGVDVRLSDIMWCADAPEGS